MDGEAGNIVKGCGTWRVGWEDCDGVWDMEGRGIVKEVGHGGEGGEIVKECGAYRRRWKGEMRGEGVGGRLVDGKKEGE